MRKGSNQLSTVLHKVHFPSSGTVFPLNVVALNELRAHFKAFSAVRISLSTSDVSLKLLFGPGFTYLSEHI